LKTPTNFLLPYKLANELVEDADVELLPEDLIAVVESFIASGDEQNQRNTLEVFKRLPRKEMLARCHKIVALTALLKKLQTNKR
jgi:hypothetical protein